MCSEIQSMISICMEKDLEKNKTKNNHLITESLASIVKKFTSITPEEQESLYKAKIITENHLSSLQMISANCSVCSCNFKVYSSAYFTATEILYSFFVNSNINEDISKIEDLQNKIQLSLSESKLDKNGLIEIKKLFKQNVILQKYKQKFQNLMNKNGKINLTEWDTKVKNLLTLFTFDAKEQSILEQLPTFFQTKKTTINEYNTSIKKKIIPYIQQIITLEIESDKQLKQLYKQEKQKKKNDDSVINPSEFDDEVYSTFDITENLDFDDILEDIKLIKKTADVDILSSTSLNVEDETPAENNRLNNRIGKFACNVNHIQEKAEDIHATNFGLYIKNNSNKELSELPKGGNEKKTIEELAQDRDFIINKKPSSHNDQVNKLTGERTLGHCTTSSDQQKVMGQDVRQKQNKSERIRAIQHQKKHQEEVKKEKETIGQKRQSNNQIFEIIEASVMEEKQNVIKAKEMIGSKNNKDKKNYKK